MGFRSNESATAQEPGRCATPRVTIAIDQKTFVWRQRRVGWVVDFPKRISAGLHHTAPVGLNETERLRFQIARQHGIDDIVIKIWRDGSDGVGRTCNRLQGGAAFPFGSNTATE